MKAYSYLIIALIIFTTACSSGSSEGSEKKSTKGDQIAYVTLHKKKSCNAQAQLERRLSELGYAREQFKVNETPDLIEVDFKNINDTKQLPYLLSTSGKISFSATFDNVEFMRYLTSGSNLVKEALAKNEPGLKRPNFGNDANAAEIFESGPLLALLTPFLQRDGEGNMIPAKGGLIGFAAVKDTVFVNQYLNYIMDKQLFPSKFSPRWNKIVDADGIERMALYAIHDRHSKSMMSANRYIKNATAKDDAYTGMPVIFIEFNEEGTQKWADLTASSIGKSIAILIDDEVVTAPIVQSAIEGGKSQISGNFKKEETELLAQIIQLDPFSCKVDFVGMQ